jgi:hypothetical protein
MSFVTDWIYGAAFFWVEWVPGGWYGVNFVAGLILGALLGKPAVAALLAVGGALMFWRRNPTDTHEHVQGKDAALSFPKPNRKERFAPKKPRPVPGRKALDWIHGEE